jgi:hypothetical protein
MRPHYGLASTWKVMAEERELTARRMAQIAVGLFIVCNVLAATSFSAQSRFADLCNYVGEQTAGLKKEGSLKQTLLNEYCG